MGSSIGFKRFRPRTLMFMTADAGVGGAPAGAPAGDAGTGDTPPAGGTPPAGEPPADQAQDVASLPQWAQDVIKNTRTEAANHRVKAQQAAAEAQQTLTANIAKALGIQTGDKTPSPEELAASLQEKDTALSSTARELAVVRAAATLNANVDALLDSKKFTDSIKELDPTDATAVKAAVEKALQDNPSFRKTQAVNRNGGDLGGGSGEDRKTKPTTLGGALDAHYTPTA